MSMLGKHHSASAKERMRKSHLGKVLSKQTKQKLSNLLRGIHNPNYGKHPSETTRLKMSFAKSGKNNPIYNTLRSKTTKNRISQSMLGKTFSKTHRQHISISHLGKTHSRKTKQKQRVAAISYIKKTKEHLRTRIGKHETALLDKQEYMDNVHITRQHEIKELGYIVDGYCIETNTVYEVYERHHNKPTLQLRDTIRQQEICNLLHCAFVIIHDRNPRLETS